MALDAPSMHLARRQAGSVWPGKPGHGWPFIAGTQLAEVAAQ
jgi:hypothetical protein